MAAGNDDALISSKLMIENDNERVRLVLSGSIVGTLQASLFRGEVR